MQNDSKKNEDIDESISSTPASNEYAEVGQIISPTGNVSNATTGSNNVIQPDAVGYSQATEVAPQPTEPKKNNTINKILWIMVLLCVAPLLLILVSLIILTALARSGASGTELMAFYLIPVVLSLPIFLPIGIISATILLFRDNKKLHRIILVVIIVIYGLIIIPSANLFLSNRQFNKKLSSVDTIELIKNCEIESFVKNDQNEVDIRYSDEINGAYNDRAHYADPNSYDKYVSAAKEMNDKCGDLRISYENYMTGESNDPLWSGDRWISKQEAIDSVLDCRINTILTHVRSFELGKDESAKGMQTNIAIRESTDTNMSGDIYVYSAADSVPFNKELSNAIDKAENTCSFRVENTIVDKQNLKRI